MVIIPITIIGCAPVTHKDLGEGVPNAKMYFELLTSNPAGGGHLGLSTDVTCKKSISLSDYTRISDFTKGHTFRDDVDKFEATIPAGKEIQLFGRVHFPLYKSCDHKIIFKPEEGANYYVTYTYNPGCKLQVYKINESGSKDAVEIKECR
jgi:hypothetical protein